MRFLVPVCSAQVRSGLLLLAIFCLSSCSTLNLSLEPPKVTIENITLNRSSALAPRFEIQMRLSNPNAVPLPVTGMSYSVALNGIDLLSGVTAEVPEIKPYSEVTIPLEIGADLVGVTRLLAKLASSRGDTIDYGLNAKIDLQGVMPTMKVSEKGKVPLRKLGF